MANLVLGVSGGIAAFKSVLLYRLLHKAGHDVRVIPTANSLKMIGDATWNGLGAGPVHTSVFDDAEGAEHVRLGRWADAVVAVCATLPPLAGDEMDAVARLVQDGPPREDVGLAPYAIDPRLNPHPADDATWRQASASPDFREGARP